MVVVRWTFNIILQITRIILQKKSTLHNRHTASTNYFFVLPIHDKNKYYKQCNRQLHCEWKKIRKAELKKLETTGTLPEYIILSSGNSDRCKVITYCSLSKIPSCAKRCLLEVIVKDDECFYLNMENVFIATKDLQVLSVKIKYDFYQSGFVPGTRKYKILDYGFCYEAREELPEMIKKLIITTNPKEWIAKEQERLNEDLYYQRQHYYYYYYYNEDEDDDSYYQDRLARKRVLYDGPPPPTSKEPYVVTPIHHHPELKEQCVRLINSEWSRSRMARFWGFESSTDTLPITLILGKVYNSR
ncbi:uncharacterized protein LOC120431011 isoform X1 [Culex pipiens pallens]|uniref:uncharacterized protein LOC120431011 isoform X1 n=1 Tax=Culex pipiens pallens TaxID=42434 RepID=UPI0022AA0E1D|nr:uncharacterized protein LOC120431011 isoform X1 [Culex pipiens pallens]